MHEYEYNIAIILCVYNGKQYIVEQLASIKYPPSWRVTFFVGDDGSVDGTKDLVKNWLVGHDLDFCIIDGPKDGFTKNFLKTIAMTEGKYDFYTFCDQDDFWFEDKLKKAIKSILSHGNNAPVIYSANVYYTDASLNVLRRRFYVPPKINFKSSLFENMAQGNTVVFNKAFYDKFSIGSVNIYPARFDWFFYILAVGSDSKFIFDMCPVLYYRQHVQNAIGGSVAFFDKFKRLACCFDGRSKFKRRMDYEALLPYAKFFTPENRLYFDSLLKIVDDSFVKRIAFLLRDRPRTSTLWGTFVLWATIIVRKF